MVPFDGGLWHFTGHDIVILNIGNYSVCTPATQLMFMGYEERTTSVCSPATQLMFMGYEERTTSVGTPATQPTTMYMLYTI